MVKQIAFSGMLSNKAKFNPGNASRLINLDYHINSAFCLLFNECCKIQISTTGTESRLGTVMVHHSLVMWKKWIQ